MDWDRIEGSLKRFKGNARQQWDKLADERVALRLYNHHAGRAVPAPFGFSINLKDVKE